ncbi:MAG: SusE domain-containing protein [Bergeyella sp.]
MKNNIFSRFLIAILVVLGLSSCEDRDIVTIENQAEPILMDLSAESLFLDSNFPDNPVLTVTWEAAEYSVPVEINYLVEASADENFSTSKEMTVVGASERAAVFSTLQINNLAGDLGLEPNVSSPMYIRVVAFLGTTDSMNMIAKSNVTSIAVTPYVLTFPDFYLVGEASYVGWNSGSAQLLYRTGNTDPVSVIYTYLESGKNFRFLGQQDWNPLNYSINDSGTNESYRYFTDWTDNISLGDNENMTFTGTTGINKITINASGKTLAVEPSPITEFDYPELYLVGSINSWSETNPLVMTALGNGVYEYATTLPDDAEFKFLGQKSWGALDWGNLSANGNTGFLGPKGDNGNIKFAGGGSTYKITVNLKAGIYTITPQ